MRVVRAVERYKKLKNIMNKYSLSRFMCCSLLRGCVSMLTDTGEYVNIAGIFRMIIIFFFSNVFILFKV